MVSTDEISNVPAGACHYCEQIEGAMSRKMGEPREKTSQNTINRQRDGIVTSFHARKVSTSWVSPTESLYGGS